MTTLNTSYNSNQKLTKDIKENFGYTLRKSFLFKDKHYQIRVLVRQKGLDGKYRFINFKPATFIEGIEKAAQGLMEALPQNTDLQDVDYIDETEIVYEKATNKASVPLPKTNEKIKKCWESFSKVIDDIQKQNNAYRTAQQKTMEKYNYHLSSAATPAIRKAKRIYHPIINNHKAHIPPTPLERGTTSNCAFNAMRQFTMHTISLEELNKAEQHLVNQQNTSHARQAIKSDRVAYDKKKPLSPKSAQEMRQTLMPNTDDLQQEDANEVLSHYLNLFEVTNSHQTSGLFYHETADINTYKALKQCHLDQQKINKDQKYCSVKVQKSTGQIPLKIPIPNSNQLTHLKDVFEHNFSSENKKTQVNSDNGEKDLCLETTDYRLSNPPNNLLFSLARFDTNKNKILAPIRVNETFTIDPKHIVCGQNNLVATEKSYTYHVYAFIHHDGGLNAKSGHYTAFIKKEGMWYECNDNKITPIYDKHYLQQKLDTAYIYAARSDNDPNHNNNQRRLEGTYEIEMEPGYNENSPITMTIPKFSDRIQFRKEDLNEIFHHTHEYLFKKSYKNPSPITTTNHQQIPRGKHNGVQGLRQAKYVQMILEEMKKRQNTANYFNTEEEQVNLMLAAYCLHAGRLDNKQTADPHDDIRSAQIYEEIAQQFSNLSLDTIKQTKQAMISWNKNNGEAQEFKESSPKNAQMCALLSTAYHLDLVQDKTKQQFQRENIRKNIETNLSILFNTNSNQAAANNAIKNANELCKFTGIQKTQYTDSNVEYGRRLKNMHDNIYRAWNNIRKWKPQQ